MMRFLLIFAIFTGDLFSLGEEGSSDILGAIERVNNELVEGEDSDVGAMPYQSLSPFDKPLSIEQTNAITERVKRILNPVTANKEPASENATSP